MRPLAGMVERLLLLGLVEGEVERRRGEIRRGTSSMSSEAELLSLEEELACVIARPAPYPVPFR